MKIARLSIKNFLGIREAVIAPGKVTILAGKNGQGKTSILKAIQAAFKGTTVAEIHKGTERAELIVDLDDVQVVRVQTKKTGAVTVKDNRGFTRPAPQRFLDGLLGDFAFNPLAFLLAEKKEKRDLLLRAMAVTVTRKEIVAAADGVEVPVADSAPALEQYADAHRFFYTQRTEINRHLKQKMGAVTETTKKLPEGFKPDEGLEERKKSVTGRLDALGKQVAVLQSEQKAAEAADRTRERIKKEQADLRQVQWEPRVKKAEAITFTEEDEQKAQDLVNELEEKLKVAMNSRDHIVRERDRRRRLLEEARGYAEMIKKNVKTLEELPPPFDSSKIEEALVESDKLKKELEGIEAQVIHAHTFAELSVLKDEVQNLEEESGRMGFYVEKFSMELPKKALAEAKLPIKGLAIEGDQIAVNGILIDQLSTSEHIAVCLSIARAMAKELPLVCIDGVERLDDDTFSEFVKQAGSDGFQYFITRVGDPREGEIAVVEGKVAG